tara:strand:- start:1119 stop:1436 length:318 start_codon:yes stop_codon:yes gene_type:complete
MEKKISALFLGLLLSACSNLEVGGLKKRTTEKMDKYDAVFVCRGAVRQEVCLERIDLLEESEKQKLEFFKELKEKKREIQALKKSLAEECISRGGIVVANKCVKN